MVFCWAAIGESEALSLLGVPEDHAIMVSRKYGEDG